MYNERLKNRMVAGQLLAEKLKKYQDTHNVEDKEAIRMLTELRTNQ